MTRKIYLLFLFVLAGETIYAQRGSMLIPPIDSNWTYFNLRDTIKGEILEYRPSDCNCGVVACASLTILKTNNEAVRILQLCDTNKYAVGQKVKIAPGNIPSFQVHIPVYYVDKMDNKSTSFVYKEASDSIRKTAWGHIIVQ